MLWSWNETDSDTWTHGTFDTITKQMSHSLKAVENLLKENGVKCFDTIESVANFLDR